MNAKERSTTWNTFTVLIISTEIETNKKKKQKWERRICGERISKRNATSERTRREIKSVSNGNRSERIALSYVERWMSVAYTATGEQSHEQEAGGDCRRWNFVRSISMETHSIAHWVDGKCAWNDERDDSLTNIRRRWWLLLLFIFRVIIGVV